MPECRFCLQEDNLSESKNALITPCLCKGSVKYVHRECIERWRGEDSEAFKYKSCTICKSNYNTDMVITIENIPNYDGSTLIKIFINPFLMPGCFNFVFACGVLILNNPVISCNEDFSNCYKESPPNLLGLFIMMHFLNAGMYCGLYINLFRHVNNKKRYLKHSLKYIWLPVSQLVALFLITETPIIAGLINHLILPLYIHKHIEILAEMNRNF